jgi:hypothetical protein
LPRPHQPNIASTYSQQVAQSSCRDPSSEKQFQSLKLD